MVEIILSYTGQRKGDNFFSYWVLTKDNIYFYRNQSVVNKEKPLSTINIKSITSNNIKQETSNKFLLQINESTRTTGLYGDYNILSYWLQAINFVIQDLVQNRQELEFLLSSQIEAPLQSKTSPVQTKKEIPSLMKSTSISRKPPPSSISEQQQQKEIIQHSNHISNNGNKQLILDKCPTENLNQKVMRQTVCLEFMENTLGKKIKISELKEGNLFVELFEKLSQTKLQIKPNAIEIVDKIHNIGTVIANTVKLCKVSILIDPVDIVRGNETEIVKFIMILFESFILNKVKVQKSEGMEGLMMWVNALLDGSGIEVEDFNSTFQDGRAFAYIISKRRPDLLDPKYLSNSSSINYSFVTKALNKCKCKIIPEEVYMDDADESSVIMILTSMMICLG
ncbi:hypothetical protein EDI_024090 [Entamoeba dispar SAW760]|uniref:Calponin-homology (CH) domain-containing protein n=1 Tax=Entamoeba dispar (strain ATCC PRA-260 / SAW760) TaxID=370354 RepID=B0EH73_ENTDS|nr:uncharacterized protein EDI_024090 [Entamoeba dispar SAW760]EDR26125.1 hypothetical protein EDI_024090 [Entamoeba dispar SAW760]|eukprot:EDR26125.1 hypothetical protein EDI_024090 [Entamoeba dispar SAW760]